MGQHRSVDYIANRPDTFDSCLPMIRRDFPAVCFNPNIFETQPLRIGPTSNTNENHICLKFFGLTAISGFSFNAQAGFRFVDRHNFTSKFKFHTLFFEHAQRAFLNFFIRIDHDGRHKFDDRDFRAQTAPNRAKLKTDYPAANNEKLSRHVLQVERAG